MYLKTPKKYRVGGRAPWWTTYFRFGWLWLLTGVIVVGGLYLYRNRTTYSPMVGQQVEGGAAWVQGVIGTRNAPTPGPTENPANQLQRANANWNGGRIEDALDDFADLTAAMPNDLVVHYNLAWGYIMQGQYPQALDAAERAVTADPFSSDAWAIWTLAQARSGAPEAAVATGQHALELNPESARAHAFLSEAYLNLNLLERAESSITTALELDAESAEAYYARGRYNTEVNFDFDAAQDDYETALRLAPNMMNAAMELAWLDYRNENYEAGIERLNAIVDANPNNATALFTLGYFWNNGVGNFDEAEGYLLRCVEAAPEDIGCYYLLGRVYVQLTQTQEAANAFARAVDLGSEDAQHHWWAARTQVDLGNCPGAMRYLQPGYQFATANDETPDWLMESYDVLFRECSAFGGPLEADATPTPLGTEAVLPAATEVTAAPPGL